MANPHPRTDQLTSFADMPRSQSAAIQSMGGRAKNAITSKRKKLREILAAYMEMPNKYDPTKTNAEVMEMRLAEKATDPADPSLKAIDMIHELLGEKPAQKIEQEQRTVTKFVSEAEFQEVSDHIDSVIANEK